MVSTADYRLVERDAEDSKFVAKSDVEKPAKRPLVMMMTWLGAEEKHIEKYRQMYFQRGFDILTVKTNPMDLVFPKNGARQIARNAIDALQNQLGQYDRVLIHAFSVGSYQLGEMLNKINELPEDKREKLLKRIKGVAMDSIAPVKGAAPGIATTVSPKNKFVAKMLENFMRSFLVVAYPTTTKYFNSANDAIFGNHTLLKPTLVMVSKVDPIGKWQDNKDVADTWRRNGAPDVTFKCWDDSAHVKHMLEHREEYEGLVDELLEKIDIYPDNFGARVQQQAAADLARTSRFNFA